MRRNINLMVLVMSILFLFVPSAVAEEFMGFDPLNFKGEMLPAETLKAMVQEAMKC